VEGIPNLSGIGHIVVLLMEYADVFALSKDQLGASK